MAKKIQKLAHSFRYAVSGIWFCIVNERNFRIHLVAVGYVLFLSTFYQFSKMEYCILALTIALVLSAEMFNTAVEATLDIKVPIYNALAGRVKDIAAGAVLICAILSIVVGLLLFWEPTVLRYIGKVLFCRPASLMLLLLSFVISMLFIFLPDKFCEKIKQNE